MFYNTCDEADAAWASSQLRPQPTAVYRSTLVTTPGRFGRVHRIYVETRRDNAIPLATQRRIVANTPCDAVVSLDCDHSPFLSCPTELARHLLERAVG